MVLSRRSFKNDALLRFPLTGRFEDRLAPFLTLSAAEDRRLEFDDAVLFVPQCRVEAPSGRPAGNDERTFGACSELSGLLGIVELSAPSASLPLNFDSAFGLDVDRLLGLECPSPGRVLRGISGATEMRERFEMF